MTVSVRARSLLTCPARWWPSPRRGGTCWGSSVRYRGTCGASWTYICYRRNGYFSRIRSGWLNSHGRNWTRDELKYVRISISKIFFKVLKTYILKCQARVSRHESVLYSFNIWSFQGRKQHFTPSIWKTNMSGLQIGTLIILLFFLDHLKQII